MYQDCHESYIVVERKTDKIFFTVLMGSQSNIRFRPVSGWERVHKTILLAQKEGFKNILGIIDKDFHVLLWTAPHLLDSMVYCLGNGVFLYAKGTTKVQRNAEGRNH